MLKRSCIYISKDLLKRGISLLFLISFVFVFLFVLGNVPAAEGQNSPRNYGELLSKAQAAGSVRIIVKLDMPFASEGVLSTSRAAVDQQQSRISRVQDELHESLSQHNATGIKRYKYIPYTAMEVDPAALTALSSHPLVISFEEDTPVPPTLTQSVPLIKADQAWVSGYTGSGWTVAILDTGVDKSHSFFSGGKVAAEACFSTISASSTSFCPNGLSSQTGSGAGVNCSETINGCSHGTQVAGIVAGKADSINGVAKDANIIAIQVFSKVTGTKCTDYNLTSPCALSYTSAQDAALEYVYSLRTTYNIAAVNMSLGGGRYYSHCDSERSSTKAAIDNLRSAGIATIIPSGNDYYCDSLSGGNHKI
jgi:subtilisin family serine protease